MAPGPAFAKSPGEADRRRWPRIRLQIPVFLRGDDAYGEEFLDLTRTTNISAVGACLASSRPLRLQQIVSLRIPAPAPPSAGLVPGSTPAITARVVRALPAGDVHLVAVEFTRPLE